jgi:hypothetical protein
VVPDDVHQQDEVELPTSHNRKCVGGPDDVELLVVVLAGDISPSTVITPT